MNIHLVKLVLQCRKSQEVVDFPTQLTFFHGQMAAGKSSIARLIDYTFGGSLEKTPAIMQELLSVELTAVIGKYTVSLRRGLDSTTSVNASWLDEHDEGGAVIAPLDAGNMPIWGDNVFNLSDLLFFLNDMIAPRVRRNKREPDAPLIRLSFRDVFWYCYLPQDNMDSSFFEMENYYKRSKSQDVMRYLVGFYSDKLNELEVALEETITTRYGKENAAKQIRAFLGQHNLGTVDEINAHIISIENELRDAMFSRDNLRLEYSSGSHFVDELRSGLRLLSDNLDGEERAYTDIEMAISEEEALKAELLTTKIKMSRSASASVLLSGAPFKICPQCGTSVQSRELEEGICTLCTQLPDRNSTEYASSLEAMSEDLVTRIEELQDSIRRRKDARVRQLRRLESLRQKKADADNHLSRELSNYDSAFTARFREIERNIATLEERFRNNKQLAALPEAVGKYEQEVIDLTAEAERLRNLILDEKSRLTGAEEQIGQIEQAYLSALLEVGVPGISASDEIHIPRNTWMPQIISGGDNGITYTFDDAGSGGKKTLLKVCYALALHAVAASNGLPLPNLLIIDSPMKNISTDVNQNNYYRFYEYLGELAEGPLAETQIIVVDNELPDLSASSIQVTDRMMTPTDPNYPPLIGYYVGP